MNLTYECREKQHLLLPALHNRYGHIQQARVAKNISGSISTYLTLHFGTLTMFNIQHHNRKSQRANEKYGMSE